MKKISGIFIVMLALAGCYLDKEEELYPNGFSNTTDTTTYYYAKDIKPLVAGSCATSGCHVAGTGRSDLSTYTGLSTNKDAVNLRAVVQRTMPTSGPLSTNDISKLRNWIAAGALNN
ncbi:MAG: hypothetical protein CFE21_14675 [Bacteroidetes bacterium B1(2017)]|nr:MAG: hypothetical protein CFE21_14675 [Bacteroidetes bacterium B1(2017)]